MSATLCRLVLSLTVVAATAVLYFVVAVLVSELRLVSRSSFGSALWVANGVSLAFLVISWLMIWRGEVRFTPGRTAATALVLLACGFAAFIVFVAMISAVRERELAIVFFGMVFALVWLAGSTLAWRETAAERSDRLMRMGVRTIACPTCGYNLTGLREAACPECGGKYTLDQLYATLLEQRTGVGGS